MTKDLEVAEKPSPNDVQICTHTTPSETPELPACACSNTMDWIVMVPRKAIEHHRRLTQDSFYY